MAATIKHLKMKSRITIEVDFENGNQPTIMVNLQKSDDVRDKLLNSFVEKFAHQRSWCKVHYMGEDTTGPLYYIMPIEPKDFVEQGKLMTLLGNDYFPKKAQSVKMAVGNPDTPRRSYVQEWSQEERDIYYLIQKIEKLGAHPLLTDVVNHLGQAKESLADWIDSEASF